MKCPLNTITTMDRNLKVVKTKHVHRRLKHPTFNSAAVTLGNFIFVVGGATDSSDASMYLYRYNIVTNEWLKLEKIPSTRARHVAAICGKTILVFGGTKGESRKIVDTSVVSYDIESNKWHEHNDFPDATASASACTGDGKIFVSGGYGCDPNDSVETYDTIHQYEQTTDTWRLIGNLDFTVMAHSMLYFEKKLYVVGGSLAVPLKDNYMDTFQCFDIQSQHVTLLTPLPYRRYFASHAIHDGKIYICGGYGNREPEGVLATDSGHATDTIFVYDVHSDCWLQECTGKLPKPRIRAFSVMVFPDVL